MATIKQCAVHRNRFTKDGFVYAFERSSHNNTTNYWRCISSPNCKVRLQIKDKVIVRCFHAHNHPLQPKRKAPRLQQQHNLLNIMRSIPPANETGRMMNTSERNPPRVNRTIDEILDRMEATWANIPNANNNTARNYELPQESPVIENDNIDNIPEMEQVLPSVLLTPPPAPVEHNVNNIMPNSFVPYVQSNGEKENFLLSDNGSGENRIMIFGRASSLGNLRDCRKWYVDGALKISSKPAPYMFVIMGEKYHVNHPMFYVILMNKDKSTFRRMLLIINSLVPNFQPNFLSCSFDQGFMSAIQDYYSGIDLHGCFFHLIENLEKHLSTLDLLDVYKTNRNFEIRAKMVIALAFVPSFDLEVCIDHLNIDLSEEEQLILHWFEDDYVGRPNRRGSGRHSPKYPFHTWNVYHRIVKSQNATNLQAKYVHETLQSELDPIDPTTENLVEKLCKIQRGRDAEFEKLKMENLRKFNFDEVEENPRIDELIKMYGSMNTTDYLRSIALQFVP